MNGQAGFQVHGPVQHSQQEQMSRVRRCHHGGVAQQASGTGRILAEMFHLQTVYTNLPPIQANIVLLHLVWFLKNTATLIIADSSMVLLRDASDAEVDGAHDEPGNQAAEPVQGVQAIALMTADAVKENDGRVNEHAACEKQEQTAPSGRCNAPGKEQEGTQAVPRQIDAVCCQPF